jgi:hypothetical protein
MDTCHNAVDAYGKLLMFGMLDYRAHKLYWLLTVPFRLAWQLLFIAIVVAAILIAQWTEYSPLIQTLVALVAMWAMSLIFGLLWFFVVSWPIEKIFFWTVDVVPSRGEDTEEQRKLYEKVRLSGSQRR